MHDIRLELVTELVLDRKPSRVIETYCFQVRNTAFQELYLARQFVGGIGRCGVALRHSRAVSKITSTIKRAHTK